MKILIVQESDWLKRNMHQQHHLAELMSLRGHEIRVIDYEIMWRQGDKELMSKRAVYLGISKIYDGAKVTVVRPSIIKLPVLDYLSVLWTHRKEIKRQLAEFKPDVMVGFGILNSYLASKMAGNVPFVYYWIDVLHELISFPPFRIIGKFLERRTLKRADKVMVINKKLKEYVVNLGVSSKKVNVLTAGVDSQYFDNKINGDEIRRRHHIKKDDTVLFFMGWLYRFSGIFEVIKDIAGRDDTGFKLVIAGDGDAFNDLLMLRYKLGVRDRVIMVGRVEYDEVPDYIAASDVCILPAQPNHRIMKHIVPIKMYEYLAMGKPVVATKLPAVVEEFGTTNGVIYVDRASDVVLEAKTLARSEAVKYYGAKARKFMEGKTWDRATDNFEELLRKII